MIPQKQRNLLLILLFCIIIIFIVGLVFVIQGVNDHEKGKIGWTLFALDGILLFIFEAYQMYWFEPFQIKKYLRLVITLGSIEAILFFSYFIATVAQAHHVITTIIILFIAINSIIFLFYAGTYPMRTIAKYSFKDDAEKKRIMMEAEREFFEHYHKK